METLSWISHPAKIRKQAAAITIVFILIIMILVYLLTFSKVMVILTVVIFTGALSTFFFPTKYELSAEKVKIKYLFTSVEKEMSMFRSYYPDRRGVLLSPFTRPSRLENFRGVYIRYHQNKEQVDAFVKELFDKRAANV